MNATELKVLLTEIAEKDLADGASIDDHPCIVAARAIDTCIKDVEYLRGVCAGRYNKETKKARMMLCLTYSPQF